MADVQIVQVDERDGGWEDSSPRFRVYLHGSSESSTQGWTDTYDITGADILQVIDWAQRQAGGSLTYAIALVYDDAAEEQLNPGLGRGLVWLIGMDGNDDPTEPGDETVQQQMLERRRSPVDVPPADRLPPGLPDPYNDGTQAR
jgi:hypothetical protein